MNIVALMMIGLGIVSFIVSGFIPVYMEYAGDVMLVAGTLLYIGWKLKHYEWECRICHTKFKIHLADNIRGMNQGFDQKMLMCPTCKKKRLCRGHRI